jgi:multicomponent Na+:H+ antiporter subunit C
VSVLAYGAAGWLLLVGLYGVATSSNFVHMVVSLSVAQASTYVLLLSVGFRNGGTAPIFTGIVPGARLVDPVVQALALTDIVVSSTVTALLLALALQAHKRTGSLDPEDTRPLQD